MRISHSGAVRATCVLASMLTLATAQAEESLDTNWAMERTRQELIYESKGKQRPEGYIVDRSLLVYSFTLGAEFTHALGALVPTERWLDIGAGEGRAIIDYATARYDALHGRTGDPGGKGQAVAISIEDRRTSLWHDAAERLGGERVQYFFGKPLREYSLNELGRFQVITDVMGGFSYSELLSVFMEKTLALLQVGGSFYTALLDVHSERGENQPHYAGSPYRTHITDAGGREIKVCAWLKSIGCAQVTCQFRDDWDPPIEVYRVHKTCDQVSVPALLPVHYQAGTPPERSYLLDRSTAPAATPVAVPTASAGSVRTLSEPR